jgi:hypothetical protein
MAPEMGLAMVQEMVLETALETAPETAPEMVPEMVPVVIQYSQMVLAVTCQQIGMYFGRLMN